MLPLPDALRGAVSIEFVDVTLSLEEHGWKETRDLQSIDLPVEAQVALDSDRLGGMAYVRDSDVQLFVATLDPPHRAVHLAIKGWRGRVEVFETRTLELVEQTALGPNPLLALANMRRVEIAQALDALCRAPSARTVSALCYHASEHPEDLFAVATATKAGANMQPWLIECLHEPHEGAVAVAAHLLGEVGDEEAFRAIDALHVWDRGVFAEAMRKIRARTQRPEARRAEAIAALARVLRPWALPSEETRAIDRRWSLWDVEGLLLLHEPRASHEAWWRFWSTDPAPKARPFAQLTLLDETTDAERHEPAQIVARVVREGRTLFEVRLDHDAVVETVRVSPPDPLGGVLVRASRDAGYRAAAVVEIGCLVARDAAWEALPIEDRRDVLYLAPEDAPDAIAALTRARSA